MKFSNTYTLLGEKFYQKALPERAPSPRLLLWNESLANELGLSEWARCDDQLKADVFSGNQIPDGAEPIALAYAGHQFGGFNPQLGDGRAHLLGELIAPDNSRVDIQLKGSGITAFSRRGDGKCGLGPALREYLMSEAMAALKVPTSRCLAVVSTGEKILRTVATPGAIVTRIASSHIRVGTFQYFAARQDIKSLHQLVDYTIARHFPEIALDDPDKTVLLLEQVINRQIKLVVAWMRVGFIHGVMNTDNTAISGETIDFGPCAMMGTYHLDTVFSSIDSHGRYAFGKQRSIANWNVARFAECLLMLFSEEEQTEVIKKMEPLIANFQTQFSLVYNEMMANKIGFDASSEQIDNLTADLTHIMQENQLDHTITFNGLTRIVKELVKQKKDGISLQSLATDNALLERLPVVLHHWVTGWLAYIDAQDVALNSIVKKMTENNPVVIPRNHHVEQILAVCEEENMSDDALDKLNEFLAVLQSPYQEITQTKHYQDAAEDNDKNYQTFCGT